MSEKALGSGGVKVGSCRDEVFKRGVLAERFDTEWTLRSSDMA